MREQTRQEKWINNTALSVVNQCGNAPALVFCINFNPGPIFFGQYLFQTTPFIMKVIWVCYVNNLLTKWLWSQGQPYFPRVHLSEGSLVRSPLKWLWSEEPMVRRSFIPKSLYSESCYVPKIPYSERPSTIWILCCEGSLVRSSSSPKGAMFRTSIFRKSPLPHTGSILRRSFSPKFPQF